MSDKEQHEDFEYSHPFAYNEEYSQPYSYDTSQPCDYTQTFDDTRQEQYTETYQEPSAKKQKPNFAISSAPIAYTHAQHDPEPIHPQNTQNTAQHLVFDTMGAVPYPQGYTQSSASVEIPTSDYTHHSNPRYQKEQEIIQDKPKDTTRVIRAGGGQIWEDKTLNDWSSTDFRIFVGDLGRDVSDDALQRAFSKYPSLLKARIVRDRKTLRTKGYGFVSFGVVGDFIKALKEMDGKFVGSRPIKLRKSTWEDRNVSVGELKNATGSVKIPKKKDQAKVVL